MYQQLGLTPEEVQMYDPEIRRDPMGAMTALSMFGEGADAPEYDFQTVLDENGNEVVMAVNKREPTDMKPIGRKPQKEEPYRYITMDGDQGPGVYVFQGNENLGKQGGVVRAPRQGARPTDKEMQVRVLMQNGDSESEALKKVYIDGVGGKGKGGNAVSNKINIQRAKIAAARNAIKNTSGKQAWQSGSGAEAGVSRGVGLVGGMIGKQWAPETNEKLADLASLKPLVMEALTGTGDKGKHHWDRIEAMFPNMWQSGKDQRDRLAQLDAALAEIDKTLGAELGEMSEEDSDPLGLDGADESDASVTNW
jgi:hypothetical protein